VNVYEDYYWTNCGEPEEGVFWEWRNLKDWFLEQALYVGAVRAKKIKKKRARCFIRKKKTEVGEKEMT